ncbi:MAG: hypothetical protein ACREK2_09905 [Gemmatimonadota bacterium]
MINRIKELRGEPEEERPPASEFFVVAAKMELFHVSRETAERLLAKLADGKPPRWLRFTDVHGSRVTLRGVLIEYVRECTESQRTAEREFDRARRRERKIDRTWDDDDWY